MYVRHLPHLSQQLRISWAQPTMTSSLLSRSWLKIAPGLPRTAFFTGTLLFRTFSHFTHMPHHVLPSFLDGQMSGLDLPVQPHTLTMISGLSHAHSTHKTHTTYTTTQLHDTHHTYKAQGTHFSQHMQTYRKTPTLVLILVHIVTIFTHNCTESSDLFFSRPKSTAICICIHFCTQVCRTLTQWFGKKTEPERAR